MIPKLDKKELKKIGIGIVAAALAAATILAFLAFLPKTTPSSQFTIEPGQTLTEISQNLSDHRLIYSRYFFIAYARITGSGKSFKAGKYNLPANTSTAKLVRIFGGGQSLPDGVLVTIPEGSNSMDISKLLGGKLADFQKNEGYLFPDSYWFGEKASSSEQIAMMRENFEIKTEPLLGHLSATKVKDTVIIASILEKEVRTEADMKLVAGIINNRLKQNMALEIDATREYDAVDNAKRDSEYNTYERVGLPVGPVSNPGLMAIRAALNPTASNYFFYLSAKDGTTIYAKTYQEHLVNRRKYLGK